MSFSDFIMLAIGVYTLIQIEGRLNDINDTLRELLD